MEPDLFQQIKSDLILLYPTPTVWADHVYVALTENGKKGMDALLTKEVQAMAWKNHSFRTIVASTADTSLSGKRRSQGHYGRHAHALLCRDAKADAKHSMMPLARELRTVQVPRGIIYHERQRAFSAMYRL